ncbi:MAG: hypothetical protein KDH20_09375 [Rhodocyclaceae bacterium]|nr:hypothetical protein [Rhodocyclaceae bacterium]
MAFPDFYTRIPRLRLQDPLAELLGACDDGWLEYGFEDAVRLAGHACPTVAMAYALTVKGVNALFPAEAAQRGALRAHFANDADEGTTGVVASVVMLLTGAAGEGGFKGLAGQHARRDRLSFGRDGSGYLLQRDDGPAVMLSAQLDRVPAHPDTGALLSHCLSGSATPADRTRFACLWQDRLRRLLIDHWDDTAVWQVKPA